MAANEATLEQLTDLGGKHVDRQGVFRRRTVRAAEEREYPMPNALTALVWCGDAVGWVLSFHQHLEEQHGKSPVIVSCIAVAVRQGDVESLGTDVGLARDRASVAAAGGWIADLHRIAVDKR